MCGVKLERSGVDSGGASTFWRVFSLLFSDLAWLIQNRLYCSGSSFENLQKCCACAGLPISVYALFKHDVTVGLGGMCMATDK